MRRLFSLGLLFVSASLSTGCAVCCNSYDSAYPYYGGAWQRNDLCHGRVGSVYTPVGSRVLENKEPAAESEMVDPNPMPAPKPAPETKPDNMTTEAGPLKSVKRARPVNSSRSNQPLND